MRILLPLLWTLCVLFPARAATANVVVTLQTVMGSIDIELFDAVAPLTVANFLVYTDPVGASYDQSFIHRSVPGFVIRFMIAAIVIVLQMHVELRSRDAAALLA